MIKFNQTEVWKNVDFEIQYSNDFRLEVSNLGRVRTFSKISKGNIIKGSMTNGYNVVRLRLFKPRDEKAMEQISKLQQEIVSTARKLKELKLNGENTTKIDLTEIKLALLKKKLTRKSKSDLKKRAIHHHGMVHRWVAQYFLPKPKPNQVLVGHLDFNKLNNHVSNLKWMTPEENILHQQKSPFVIQEKKERLLKRKDTLKTAKLTVTKVMLLKKLLNKGKPMKQLVRQFKVTETQIYRIKKGENWPEIPAAN